MQEDSINHLPKIGSTISVLALILVGATMLKSAKWIMLSSFSNVPMTATYVSRFFGMATYAAALLLFNKRIPNITKLLVITVAFIGLYLISYLIGPSLDDELLQQLIGFFSVAIYGVGDALFDLIMCHVFASFTPRKSACLFAVVQLTTNSLMIVLGGLDAPLLYAARGGAYAVGLPVFAIGVLLLLHNPDITDHVLQFDAETGAVAQRSTPTIKPSRSFPAKRADWVFVYIVIMVFDALFGIVAQVSSRCGSSFALYDLYAGIILIFIDILVLTYLWVWGDRFSIAGVIGVIAVLSATGFTLYLNSWTYGNTLVGSLVRAAYDCSCIFMQALMARLAFQRPQRTYFYFSIFFLASNLYPWRALGSMLSDSGIPQIVLVTGVSQVALWIISIFGVFSFLFAWSKTSSMAFVSCSHEADAFQTDSSGKGRSARTFEATLLDEEPNNAMRIGQAQSQGNSAESGFQIKAFSEALASKAGEEERETRLLAFANKHNLTMREREVVRELLHGQTRAGIAEKLFLSPETVKKHLGNVYAKTGVKSKQELIDLIDKTPGAS